MELFFDTVPSVCFAIRADRTVVNVNAAFCAKLGYTKEEITGKKSDALFTVATRIFQQTHFLPLLKMQGFADEIYITLQAKDGRPLPLLVNATWQETGEGAVAVYAGIVVHNRKKFEDELVAAKKAAEAALHENTALLQAKKELQAYTEQLDEQIEVVTKQHAELRQFNRVVTHNLQEPLRKLLIFSGMLHEAADLHAGPAILEKLKRVLEQMQTVLSGLQQYVWLTETATHAGPVAIETLLAEVLPQLKAEFPDVAIRLDNEALPPVEGDREQLQFLLYQLLSNAVRFRKPGAGVHIQLLADTLLQNTFRNVTGKYKYRPFLKLQIKDDGRGFNPEYKAQAFELFRRLHPEGGRGIGLALCKKIVANHHGTITIDSKAGQGTTVCVTLPLQTESTEPPIK